MSEIPPVTRRTFLEKAATITALGFAAPHLASAADSSPSASRRPNSRIHLGLIGCGGRCHAHYDAVASENVVALCDVDSRAIAHALNTPVRYGETFITDVQIPAYREKVR